LFEENLDLLGVVIEYCPNIEIIETSRDHNVCSYIASEVRRRRINKEENLWRNLQKIDVKVWGDSGDNAAYRFLYTFRNSLQYLSLLSGPKMSALMDTDINQEISNDDDTRGTQQDISAYIQGFKHLKFLHLARNSIDCILDCESILQHCSIGRNDVQLYFFKYTKFGTNVDNVTLPLSPNQQQIAHNPEENQHVQKLTLQDYLPENALFKFMYMRNKFVNLKELNVQRQFGQAWRPITTEDINFIANYTYQIPKFCLVTGLRVNMEVVQQFFKFFMKYGDVDTKRIFEINLTVGGYEGISIRNHTNWPNRLTKAPIMELYINEEPFYQESTNSRSITEVLNILKHVGPLIHVLNISTDNKKYDDGSDVEETDGDTFLRSFSMDLMSNVLSSCPKLQALSMADTRFIDCAKMEPVHDALELIRFRAFNKFEDGFFGSFFTSP
jgi:hypothetical protein